jgi:hypothetical protein
MTVAASRKRIRHALADLLRGEITLAQAVYRYQKANLKGQTPVLCVTSAGSRREPLTMQGSTAGFRYDIHVFTLYKDASGAWTEEQAEDMLDDIEQQVAATCDKYRKSTAWARLVYADPSDARTPVTLGGVTYLHEIIPVAIQEHT